jgi:DNA (cytosine-5)-methyltransferase 1
MAGAYYNEFDAKAAAWLRQLIKAGLIADGDVDERSVTEVRADDLRGYSQCHFFAGIGGWSYALRLAGWPDERPVWTGSCPCQPFSVAGRKRGFDDERHLWPVWRNLIAECSPAVVFGEQVASATQWLGLVRGDLEALGYAMGAMPLEAASAGAYHKRDRYWFVADADSSRSQRRGDVPQRARERAAGAHGVEWIVGHDGKARRIPEPGIRLLAHGVSARVAKLRGFGNAIDPRPAAAFIRAVM